MAPDRPNPASFVERPHAQRSLAERETRTKLRKRKTMPPSGSPAGHSQVSPRQLTMAVLINSSDGFSDCWFPFFRLFETFWPQCRFPLYLNIESGSYCHSSLDVRCLNHPPSKKGLNAPWSNRLLASLAAIPEQYVLYMQEDYFIDAVVDQRRLEECLALVDRTGLGCLHLTPYGAHGGLKTAELPYLVDVPRLSQYRLSTQAAIWNKHVLASYVRPNETVWETEILGTLRSWSKASQIRTLAPPPSGGRPIISYTGTGVIRGKWHPAMEALFARHGIAVDFSRRGFYEFPSRWATRSRMIRSLLARPDRPLAALLGL